MYSNRTAIKDWKTCLSTIVDERNKMVHVSFKHAPPEYGFVNYTVSLNNAETHRLTSEEETKGTSVNFTDLKNGKYLIVVYPLDYENKCDPYCSRQKSDIFRIGENTTHLQNLTVCGKTRTTSLITRSETISTQNANANLWKLYFLLLPLLFVIMAFILYKWKRSLNNVNELNITNLTTNTTTSTGKLKVFVFYTEDHLFHTEACLSFIHYLNEHCFCDVLNTYPEYSSVPAYDMEKYSDFVLVINSQAFHIGFCAWKCAGSDLNSKNHPCLEVYEKILQNVNHSPTSGTCEYLMCAMDYTDGRLSPPEFSSCQLFKIVNDMTALVCYMHNLDLSSINEYNVPHISEHIYSSPDGNALITAIENAEYFEMTQPNWFQEKDNSSHTKERYSVLNNFFDFT